MEIQAAIILLVEDNPDDVFFMERALLKSGLDWSMQVVMDGRSAVDYLAGAGKYANRNEFPIPALVFLDLKLPYKSGFEVLSWMKNQPALVDIPVLVLTSSPENRDRTRVMEMGARDYLIKPPTEDLLQNIAAGNYLRAENSTTFRHQI
ncbi:MAG TPA: response regulator [Candidatus Saccharimonadales bacterium]|nr:response regulator [Candidatus Saccharimonadales bacterium]